MAAPTLPPACTCMSQFSTGCTQNSDCCSGQICRQYGPWSQCVENPIYQSKASPQCKFSISSPSVASVDFGCTSNADW